MPAPPPSAAAASAPPARLGAITPFFIVADLAAAVRYYEAQLGFTLEFSGPAGDPYYAQVRRDDAALMLKAIAPDVAPMPNPSRHPWARWDAHVHVADPDTLHAEFAARGARITRPLGFIDDGLWGFEVADADGYVIAFFCLRDGAAP